MDNNIKLMISCALRGMRVADLSPKHSAYGAFHAALERVTVEYFSNDIWEMAIDTWPHKSVDANVWASHCKSFYGITP